MDSTTVITCFGYPTINRFTFNPDHLRSDLRRLLAFSHNRLGSTFQETFVLTDICPDKIICNKMIQEFQTQVRMGIRKRDLKISTESRKDRQRPILWLNHLVGKELARELLSEILPVIHRENSVEFASLFTNFSLIRGRADYEKSLTEIFTRSRSHLFFYYSGHGVKIHNYDMCLVIPGRSGRPDFYPRGTFQKRFREYLSHTNSVIIFDCCYGEDLLNLPCQIGFRPGDPQIRSEYGHSPNSPQIICLSGTRSDQTCGFYVNGDDCSSLYTYFLMNCLNSISQELRFGKDNRELSRLYYDVELKVQEYRQNVGKPSQNMLIGLSHPSICRFPKWLFRQAFTHQKDGLLEFL